LLASEAEALTPQGGRAGARRRPRRRCGCASNASCRSALPRDKARGLKARVTASGMITGRAGHDSGRVGDAWSRPDKTGRTGVQDRRGGLARGRSG